MARHTVAVAELVCKSLALKLMTHKVNPQFLWGSPVNHKIISVDYILVAVRLLSVLAKSNAKIGED